MSYAVLVGLVTLAAIVLRGVLLGYPRAAYDTRELSSKEQAILSAAADALLPHGGSLPMSATEADVVPYFASLLAGAPRRTAMLIHLLLHFVEHGPWLFGPSPRFTSQSAEQRARTMRAWSDSRIYFLRVSFMSLRTLLVMAYLAHPTVAARLGTADTNVVTAGGAS